MRILSALTALALGTVVATTARAINIQEDFDPLGPTVHKLALPGGKTIAYIDDGDPAGIPVVFVGGAGTSVRVFGITEFLRTLRKQLGLRVISVERDGFGETAFTPGWSYADYAAEVEALLDHLGVDSFVAAAISGGGPYLTEVVARLPGRVRSVHLIAAYSQLDPDDPAFAPLCALPEAQLTEVAAFFAANPNIWFAFAPDSPVHIIPGFQDSAFEDAARTFFVAGQLGDPAPLTAELRRYCKLPVADVSALQAPAFIYQGTADSSVDPLHAAFWEAHYPNVAKVRIYEGEGHDIQYRHWDQILVDMAGKSSRTVLCKKRRSLLLPEAAAEQLLAKGATLGICAWQALP
jgi:pimeloyl-ACP methyl ester carboxylesterase